MAARHLPAAVDAGIAVAGRWREGQALDVFWCRLVIVKRGRRVHCIAKSRVNRHIGDTLAVYVHFPSVLERGEMVSAGLDLALFGHVHPLRLPQHN